MRERYPTRHGIPVHPGELGFESDPTQYQENHHHAYSRRWMAEYVISQTFRDLNSMQSPLPKEPHRNLHNLYLPPKLDLASAYDYVWEAYEHTEQMRFGSVKNFYYKDLTPEHMARVEADYQSIKHLL